MNGSKRLTSIRRVKEKKEGQIRKKPLEHEMKNTAY